MATLLDVSQAIRNLGLSGRAICVHSSFRSLGAGSIDPIGLVEAFQRERCTVLVPAFSWTFATAPPPGRRPTGNGYDYGRLHEGTLGPARTYGTDLAEVDADMGVIPRTILTMPGHLRSGHPLCSFAAFGERASDLVPDAANTDFSAPLNNLCALDGSVLLIGVDLRSTTLIHVAEKLAGRNLFRRWARTDQGIVEVEAGGCSTGFANLEPALQPLAQRTTVGSSAWTAYSAQELLAAASKIISGDASITHCGDTACGRCDDAVRGGPDLTS